MRDGNAILRTADVADWDRIGFWTRALGRVCSGLETDGYGADTLDGRLELACVGRLKLGDISASRHRVTSSPDRAIDARKATVKVVYQTAGISIYQQGGVELTVKPGDCVAYDVSRPHAVISPEASRHLVVALPSDAALLSGICLDETPLLRPRTDGGLSGLAASFIRSTISEVGAVGPECDHELTDMILTLVRLSLQSGTGPAPCPSLNGAIKGYIQRNLRDPELTLDRLARDLGSSKRRLHQSFAAEALTIAAYLWAARLDQCRRELASSAPGRRSITEIAFSWGFSSSSHFSRSFRNRFGCAPSSVIRRSTG